MIPDPRNTPLLNDIDSKLDALMEVLRRNQDSDYTCGYIHSVIVNHLRDESKACQKRFLEDIDYFLNASRERYAYTPTEQAS
jgi:hypothetical protein